VTDLLSQGLQAVATRSPLALPLVFAAGAATSVGPCLAPRYVAVAALAQGARRPWLAAAAFAAGLIAAYAALVLAAGSLGALVRRSPLVYAMLAAALVAAGIAAIVRGDRAHVHGDADASEGRPERCAASPPRRTAGGIGGALLLGASSALVVSPCCTPVVAAIAGFTVSGTRPADGVALVAAFACGHALPLAAVASLGNGVAATFARFRVGGAGATVAGTLMIAVGAYYAVLA